VSLNIVAGQASVATGEEKETMLDTSHTVTARAIFAGGCFWCMEPPFKKLDGVHAVIPAISAEIKKTPPTRKFRRG
jgi:hypothetical protein